MRSGGPWQVARCTILAIKVVEMGPENAWVDAADLQSASWAQLRVEENLSPHSFVVPGTRFWAVHDPAYTRRAHGLATPDHGWTVGETRFTILQHLVGLGIVWKGTRLMVMGPLCDPKDGQPPSR